MTFRRNFVWESCPVRQLIRPSEEDRSRNCGFFPEVAPEDPHFSFRYRQNVFFFFFFLFQFFPDFLSVFGQDITFWIFTVVSGIGVAFIYFAVPETKGKTLEEIQRDLSGVENKGFQSGEAVQWRKGKDEIQRCQQLCFTKVNRLTGYVACRQTTWD